MTTNPLPTGHWELDPSTTTVSVSVKKMGFFAVPATLTMTSGSIDVDVDGHVTDIDIAIDARSYRSKNDERNEHVLSADFLDAENHPTIQFSAKAATASPDGYQANGVVTIKDKRAPVTVQATNLQATASVASFAATATADRNVLGVDKMPSFVIGNELQITVDATATKTN